jgi:dTDP-4-amino-4,6-dideoxygalactose transaminase
LKAFGIKKGDEVILPTHTFIATSEAVSSVGATPIFVDICEDSFNIDAEQIKKKISEKTKAIIPVHLYGQMCDMGSILDLAEKKDLIVIEDACQAHLSEYKGKRAPISQAACFSFFPGKNLGAYGDAGAVVTNDKEISDQIMMLRDHGREIGHKYDSKIEGFGHRLDTIQAAVLLIKVKHIEKWTGSRRKNAMLYNEFLADTGCACPVEMEYGKHVYHLYVIKTKRRDSLQGFLKEKGVFAGIHYPIPLHLQPAYSHLDLKKGSFPVAERICEEILSLPMFAELSQEQIGYVCDSIKEFEKYSR